MSFTRRMKYGNIMATRKLKKNVSLERVEVVLFLSMAALAMLVINIAITSM